MAILAREDTRSFCGDLTVSYLAEDNCGEGFLKLLRVYLHDDTSFVPTTPITFPYNRNSGSLLPDTTPNDVWRATFELDRDLYICLFVLQTLSSWENKPRPPPSLAIKMPIKGELHPTLNKVFKDALGSSGLKEIKQEIRVGHAAAHRSCESCGAVESRTKFMQCKVCADVLHRRTFYCSKKCQRHDWPSHKRICGKPMTLETARNTAITSTKLAALKYGVERPEISPAM
ncbi:hypothetical protein Hypma_003628 [Hypsizygus marmoreus]|uniref:MYND-type domain-containing protein n=1 Tax=Hypsizygus marmoreus TaxID=39966 RepID=A0A369J8M6_HYPMA|nr:hypothetical protein Hypma_003628 [Hypsizygus marmoreus]